MMVQKVVVVMRMVVERLRIILINVMTEKLSYTN